MTINRDCKHERLICADCLRDGTLDEWNEIFAKPEKDPRQLELVLPKQKTEVIHLPEPPTYGELLAKWLETIKERMEERM